MVASVAFTLTFYTYCANNPTNCLDPLGYWAIGDSEYSYEVQLQLLALTIAYEKAVSNTGREYVAKQAKKLRETAVKQDKPLPFASLFDSFIRSSPDGSLSKGYLDAVLSRFRIKFTGTVVDTSSYRLHTGLTNENLLNIVDSEGKTYKGGDQEWLETEFQNETACGSISVINVVYYYYLRFGCGDTNETVSQQDYIDMYYRYFGRIIGSFPMIIFPYGYTYAADSIFYDMGLELQATKRASDTPIPTALSLIAWALMTDNPVALQNWRNSAKRRLSWHWVTLTSVDIDVFDLGNSIINYSTWGDVESSTFADAWSSSASIVFYSKPGIG